MTFPRYYLQNSTVFPHHAIGLLSVLNIIQFNIQDKYISNLDTKILVFSLSMKWQWLPDKKNTPTVAEVGTRESWGEEPKKTEMSENRTEG